MIMGVEKISTQGEQDSHLLDTNENHNPLRNEYNPK